MGDDEKCDKCLKNTEYFEYLILFKEIHEKEFKIKNILKKKILYEIIR